MVAASSANRGTCRPVISTPNSSDNRKVVAEVIDMPDDSSVRLQPNSLVQGSMNNQVEAVITR